MNKFIYKPYLYYNLFFRNNILKKRNSYSQHGEDIFLKKYFKKIKKGFYVDIGCYHPVKYSNTAWLYNNGWRGINFDMNKTSIDLFNIARPHDKNICAAISNKNKTTYAYFDRLISPINTLNKKFSDFSSKNISFREHKKVKINTYKFNYIIKKKRIKIPYINFLNIDAEAHDFQVLSGFNIKKFNPKLICVELLDSITVIKKNKFIKFFKKRKYRLLKKIGPNGFFEKF